ncbi:MAG: multidrug transporter AcrB [Alcanivorax sp.]|nr:multidrug transporter AcrB [Alcanivorax sp.]
MILSDTSIKRPVFATVLSLLIVVFGIAAALQLPIREYPDIDPPEVSIATSYQGAAPEVIDSQITQLIEGAISAVDGIRSMESRSRIGSSRTTVEFDPDRDVDNAANDIRDAIANILDRLPDEADPPVVAKANADARPMMWVTMASDRMSPDQLTDYAERNLVDRLSVLSGVAEIMIGGQRRFAMRIWLDPDRMASRQVTVTDIENALRANNIELPAGRVESTSRELAVRADNRLQDPDDFARITIRREGDYPIRIGDVARVERGVEDDRSRLSTNGQQAIGLGIIRQSQSNVVAISDLVQAELDVIRENLPAGISLAVNYDESIFIRASIREVLITLTIAMSLVILVIFVFLRSVRATLIPAVTIPVSVIGAFIALGMFDFSINVLTLLALILAIGLVVDDAIVMLENIQRRIDEGEPPLVAAYRGARQVAFAVVATTLTLVAVFVPLSFMGGNIGRLFTEFGFTLAAAVIVSSFVALTLAPMLCSKWLHPAKDDEGKHSALWEWTERGFEKLNSGYRTLLLKALGAPLIVLAVGLSGIFMAVAIFPQLPQELAPIEDRGVFIVPSRAPEGSSIDYTDHHTRKLQGILQPLVENGEAERVLSIVGFRGEVERGFSIVRLKPWGERERTQQQIVGEIMPKLPQVPGLRSFAVNPPGLGQSGFNEALQFVIGGPDYESVEEWARIMLARAEANPNLLRPDINYEVTQPQLGVDMHRDRAADLSINASDIGNTLQSLVASRVVTRYQDRGREYDVVVQAEEGMRATPDNLENYFLRTGANDLVPLSAVAALREFGAAPELRRVDRLPAITLSATLGDGYDMGAALAYLNAEAREHLPSDARISYRGVSREFVETSSAIYITFGLAFLIVFLVLAAQFESWIHPMIIMLSVPLAITGALLALFFSGISLNIYSQIGMIMLLGLMAKNGILIVEFANQMRDQGMAVREAIIEGATLRFRPVLMTTISTIFGAIPLVLATGAGAESRAAIGTVILGGLLFATVLTLFIIPVLYNLLARFAGSVNKVSLQLEAQTAHHEARAGGLGATAERKERG